MSCLLLDAKDAVEQAKADGRTRLSTKTLAQLHSSYRELIALGYEENPDLAGRDQGRRPKRTKAQNLLLRLDEREQEVLRVASDFRVPFDNNLSERDHADDQAAAEDLRLLAHDPGSRAVPGDPLLPLHRPQATTAPDRRARRPGRRPAVAAHRAIGLNWFDPHQARSFKA